MANDETLHEDEAGEMEEALASEPEQDHGEDLGAHLERRYLTQGRDLLSDALPSQLDPRVVKRLEPILGDVGHVRVHTGAAATAAARAMDARAFAVGDSDIYIDERQYNPGTEGGGALLAHEVAHTMDAATGFAMSSDRGQGEEGAEAFAREVEMSFAQEDAVPATVPETIEPPRQTGTATTVNQGDPQVDMWALEERVMEMMEKAERDERDRTGH